MSSQFPRQDLPEIEKNKDWCKQVLDYAITVLNDQSNSNRLTKIQRMRNSYNGILDKRRTQYLTKTYGKRIKGQFIDYRLGKPKIDLVNGEFLKRKLNSEVRSQNRDAKAKKLDKLYTVLGIREAQPQIRKLREVMGFDAFDGMDIPTQEKGTAQSKINIKTKNEIFMSHVLKDYIKRKGLKAKLSKNFFDVENTAECHGRVYIKSNRTVEYETIRPEDAIFIESYDDPFLKYSPINGHRRWMFVNDILNEYELSKEDRDKLESMKGQSTTLTNPLTPSYTTRCVPLLDFFSSMILTLIMRIRNRASSTRYLSAALVSSHSKLSWSGLDGSRASSTTSLGFKPLFFLERPSKIFPIVLACVTL